jgi:hypothetical protein
MLRKERKWNYIKCSIKSKKKEKEWKTKIIKNKIERSKCGGY